MKINELIFHKIIYGNKIERIFWSYLRKMMIKLKINTNCKVKIHGYDIEIPFSHELPIYLNRYPLYDRLLGRIATYLRESHQSITMIDVGANIGDSILATFPTEDDCYLAIEPSTHFSSFLEKNLSSVDYRLVRSLLTDKLDDTNQYTLYESKGTATVLSNKGNANNKEQKMDTLDNIIFAHDKFKNANLLKVDTDGFDFKVLKGASEFLRSKKPFVLFECDDFNEPNFIEEAYNQIKAFAEMGYLGFIVYDNFGVMIGHFNFSEKDMLNFKNLLQFKLISHYFYYFDVLVYTQEDKLFSEKEQAFFESIHGEKNG